MLLYFTVDAALAWLGGLGRVVLSECGELRGPDAERIIGRAV